MKMIGMGKGVWEGSFGEGGGGEGGGMAGAGEGSG